ncbi:MAG: diadenosine tetraphosphatase [Deltaproteobacteria bacterium]|nr:diadenosine tetraphosphatase [Deltaproteobacteria bacterium]
MPTYAIGDIQGCFNTFQKLLKHIRFDENKDTLWLAGDLVNRGPRSKETLQWVYEHRTRLEVVLGNHELHLLFRFWGKREEKKGDTIKGILESSKATLWLNWLSERDFVHFENNYLMVHAGILPSWDLQKILQHNEEAKIALKKKFMLPELFAIFTRMRCLDENLVLNPDFSGPPEACPKPFKPWFEMKMRLEKNITILFGHWAALGVRQGKNWQSLDSGCVWKRELTALRLEDRKIFQMGYCD